MPRVNSETREARWTISVERERTLSPSGNRNFSTMRMIRHRPFPSKDESTNGGRGHQTTKKRKKSRRNGVNAEEGPALTPLRLHFLRFLSFDDLDDHSLSHLGRANFDVESFSYQSRRESRSLESRRRSSWLRMNHQRKDMFDEHDVFILRNISFHR